MRKQGAIKIHYLLVIFSACLSLLSCGGEEEMTPSNPVLPALTIADAQIVEGDSDKTLTFQVNLAGQMAGTAMVEFRTVDGTATAGSDYTAVSGGTLSFGSGVLTQDIVITILGDTEVEVTETFEVELLNPVNARVNRSKATGTIENDDLDAPQITADIPGVGYTTPESYDGMTLVWRDEFQAEKINLDDWTHEMGDGCPNICGWGNNELQFYQPQNTAILDEEYLVIEAREEDLGTHKFTSSRIITKDVQEFRYGRIDIRAALPKGQGIWPALWMLGANIDQVSWPACGEIDIMEIIGNMPSRVHGTAHWDDNGNYATYGQSRDLVSGDFSDEFHVFSIVWTTNSIAWLLDDVQYNLIDISPPGLSEFRNPFFLIFNVAVGGNWPGNPDNTTVFPQHLIVDYIRVFQ